MTTENSSIEYYGYFVTHAYMSQIQRGIQSAHVIQSMYEKYSGKRDHAARVFRDWMNSHRTMIVLNGGNSAMVKASMERTEMRDGESRYPLASFHEDEQSMEGMMTAWGIILPKTNRSDWKEDEVYGGYVHEYEERWTDYHEDIYLEALGDMKLA